MYSKLAWKVDLATIVAVKGTKKQNIIRQTVTQLSLQQWGKENLKVRHNTLKNVTANHAS